MCLEFLCHVYGLISQNLWLFLWSFICGLFQVLFLTLVVKFYFFNSHFLVTTLGLDLFTGTYFKKLLVLWCPVIGNNLIQGASLPANGNSWFLKSLCMFKKLDEGSNPKKDCVSFWQALFSLLDFLALEAGTDRLS
jgi:hypothetical protein